MSKPQAKRRSSLLLRSPSFGAETWNWLRRKKPASRVSSDSQRASVAAGATPSGLSHYDKCRKSQSMTSLDQIHTLSYSTGSCDNLTDDSLFQRSADSEYQLWVRTGKDDPPYPLIGEYPQPRR